MFTPGSAIWTIDGLSVLDDRVGTNIGEGKWVDRLVAQVEDLAPEHVQLAAELLYVMLLPQSDTHAPTKRAHLHRVLALMPEPVVVPPALDVAFDGDHAVANFSSAKAWSPMLLRFVARLAIHVKGRSDDERNAALSDPWRFRAVTEAVRTSTDRMIANALKHMLFPDTFDYMISPVQRSKLIKTFRAAPGVDGLENDDQQIERIRDLASSGDKVVNFYDEAVRHVWSKPADARWDEAVRLAARLYARDDFDASERAYKLKIAEQLAVARAELEAGSSHWATMVREAFKNPANNLVNWRVSEPLLKWVEEQPDAAADALRALWQGGGDEPSAWRGFLAALPTDVVSGPGTRASVMSFLLMGADATRFAFFRPTVNDGIRRALGLERVASVEIDEESAYRPEDLAARLGLDGQQVRDYLRGEFPRPEDEHGAAWSVTPAQASAVLDHFRDKANITAPDALYAGWLSLLEELRLRMLTAGVVVGDLLDAQGLVWWLVQGDLPDDWSEDEHVALATFREGSGIETALPPPPHDGVLPKVDAQLAAKLHLPAGWLDGLLGMLEEKKQLILYGPPGTGKTFVAQHIGRHLEAHGGGFRLVQFHPSYTYEDFFEGYRPQAQAGGTLGFQLVSGALREIAEEARANPGAPYLLVIDEINRGNIAKIFGELYFLLEYRDEGIHLQYSPTERFALPENLFLVGTMNTADRSIALIDSALRRRFYFLELSPTAPPVAEVLDSWLQSNDLEPEPAILLRALNAAIDDDEFAIGPSYFITKGDEPNLDRIWANAIMPLLQERFYGTDRDLGHFELAALRRRIAHEADTGAPDDDGA
jgi:hypothetical protein